MPCASLPFSQHALQNLAWILPVNKKTSRHVNFRVLITIHFFWGSCIFRSQPKSLLTSQKYKRSFKCTFWDRHYFPSCFLLKYFYDDFSLGLLSFICAGAEQTVRSGSMVQRIWTSSQSCQGYLNYILSIYLSIHDNRIYKNVFIYFLLKIFFSSLFTDRSSVFLKNSFNVHNLETHTRTFIAQCATERKLILKKI